MGVGPAEWATPNCWCVTSSPPNAPRLLLDSLRGQLVNPATVGLVVCAASRPNPASLSASVTTERRRRQQTGVKLWHRMCASDPSRFAPPPRARSAGQANYLKRRLPSPAPSHTDRKPASTANMGMENGERNLGVPITLSPHYS